MMKARQAAKNETKEIPPESPSALLRTIATVRCPKCFKPLAVFKAHWHGVVPLTCNCGFSKTVNFAEMIQ